MMQTLNLVNELWQELKQYINDIDHAEAADTLISVLIDHDQDPDQIKTAFRGDADVKSALNSYIEDEEETEEEYDDDEEDEDY